MAEAASIFDQSVTDTALRFLRISPSLLNNEARIQLALPIRLGGIGYRRSLRTAPFAFWGGIALAAPHLAVALPNGLIPANSPLADAVTEAASAIRDPARQTADLLLLPPPDQFLAPHSS